MSLDVIIRRNISFVGCILIIAATELSKISRSLFIALQWRRRCISSLISFDSHLVDICWFIGVIGLLYRPISIFKSCELIRYLAIVVMMWFPFIFKMYGFTQIYSLIMQATGMVQSQGRHFTEIITIFSEDLNKIECTVYPGSNDFSGRDHVRIVI